KEEQEQRQQEEMRRLAEQKKAEEARLAEEKRKADEAAHAEQARQEAARLAEAQAAAAATPPPTVATAPTPEPPTTTLTGVRPGTLVSLTDPGVTPPVVEKQPALAYPEIARRQRVEGIVELNVLVDERGNVTDAQVVQGVRGATG